MSSLPKGSKIGPIVLTSLAIVLIIAIGVRFSNRRLTAVNADERPAGIARVEVTVARAGSFASPRLFHVYRGEIRPRRESNLAIRRSGRLVEVLVEEGDRVERDQPLARLDTSDLEVRKQIADAEIASATAAFDEAIAGPRYQTLKAAAARLRQLDSQLAAAENAFQRQRKLSTRDAGTDQELDDAKFAVDALAASVAAASAELDELNEGTRGEQIAAARAAVAAAGAARRQIDVDELDSQIFAPYDGVIASRLIDEGEMVGDSDVVLRILQDDPVEASFGVPAAVTRDWKVGDRWWVAIGSPESSPDSPRPPEPESPEPESPEPRDGDAPRSALARDGFSSGSVSRMQPQVDPVTRTRGVDLEIRRGEAESAWGSTIHIGQTATLWVPWIDPETIDGRPAFWVPTDSLVRGSRGLWAVYVAVPTESGTGAELDDSSEAFIAVVERREIEILRAAGAMSSITGMVQPGEWIVTEGTNRVGPGVEVHSHAGVAGVARR